MALFKQQSASAPSRLLFTRILAWNARSPRLISPAMVRSKKRFENRRIDAALVSEFRGKLHQTEELIGKLGYSLRELRKMHH